MGDRDPQVVHARRAQAERARSMTAIYAVMVAIMILIVLQFLILMVGIESFLAGERSVLIPAALGSGVCFAASCWLIRYVSLPRTEESR